MYDWNDIKMFLVAYRAGSIGRAAEALGVSGSTVSRRLSAFEEALGQTLFLRSPEGLIPTEAGQKAWGAAQETERAAVQLSQIAGAHDVARGAVRVSLSSELLYCVLLPRWAEFSEQYPEISVEFLETTRLSDLERWEADIALRVVRPASGEHLVFTRLRETGFGLFAGVGLLKARGIATDEVALEQQAAENWADWPWLDWTEDLAHLGLALFRARSFPDARVVLRARSLETLRLAAAAGSGLVLLPTFFGAITPTLVRLPLDAPPPAPLYMLSHSAIRQTARVDAVWRFLEMLLRGDDETQLGDGKAAISAAYGVTFEAN